MNEDVDAKNKGRAYIDYLIILGYLSTIVGPKNEQREVIDCVTELYKIAAEKDYQ